MPRRKKSRPGRPSLGDKARTIPVVVKVSEAERTAWRAEAGDRPLGEWIRAHCNGPATRLTVERDIDGTIAWWAYNALGDALGWADIELGPNLDRRVFRAAGEHGVDFDEDSVAFEDLT